MIQGWFRRPLSASSLFWTGLLEPFFPRFVFLSQAASFFSVKQLRGFVLLTHCLLPAITVELLLVLGHHLHLNGELHLFSLQVGKFLLAFHVPGLLTSAPIVKA
jgi:hypothetical protein